MKKFSLALLLLLSAAPAFVGAREPVVLTPRELLFEPETKDQLMKLSKEERVETIGGVLALTNHEKKLIRRQISERAYKVEECVSKNVKDAKYQKRDAMTVISDCVVILGYD